MTFIGNSDRVTKSLTKPRRFCRVSLRTLLVLITIGCVWLGSKVNKAQKQRPAVAWIEQMGGHVIYEEPHGPRWLIELMPLNFLADVTLVSLDGEKVLDLSRLANLPDLLLD